MFNTFFWNFMWCPVYLVNVWYKIDMFHFFCVIALFFMMFLVLEPLHFLEDETFTRLQNKSYTSKL